MSKYTLDCTQLNNFLKIFSEEHTLKSPSSKIEQHYKHRTTTQAECITILQYLSIISKIMPPYLNMDFFYKELFIQAPPPPPIMIGCVHNIAMLAFPQEIISHYTTAHHIKCDVYGIFTLYRICSLKQFIKTFNSNFILI